MNDRIQLVQSGDTGGEFGQRPNQVLRPRVATGEVGDSRGQKIGNGQKPNKSVVPVQPARPKLPPPAKK
ncbi:hypothetical protein OG474_30270 [Kribbella sp. NBC_01505]|uniref:hypothetical protein n=1 Tax=Kribbella sp. NBC_01505 TaxID=2903580 RepID=UPI003868D62D